MYNLNLLVIKIHKEGCTKQNIEQHIKSCIRMCVVVDVTFGLSLDSFCRVNRKQRITSMHSILLLPADR